MRSKFLNIDYKDLAKGFVTSFFTAVLTAIVVVINTGTIPTNLEFIGILKIAFLSGIAYLIKNLFTNSEDDFLTKEFKVIPKIRKV